MANMFLLSITPVKLSDIPSEESILAAGRAVLEGTRGWKEGKSYNHHTVKTFSHSKGLNDGAAWHCRVSEHTSDDATFDEFWDKLGNNKAENEKEFISEIKKNLHRTSNYSHRRESPSHRDHCLNTNRSFRRPRAVQARGAWCQGTLYQCRTPHGTPERESRMANGYFQHPGREHSTVHYRAHHGREDLRGCAPLSQVA